MSDVGDREAPLAAEALERLAYQAASFETLIEALPDIYFLLGEDGTILDYRAQRHSELYVPKEVFLGRRMWEVLPPDVAGLLSAAVSRATVEGRLVAVEYTLPMSTGLEHYEARVVPSAGSRIAAFVRNISAEKRAMAAHAQAASLLKATLEATADGILVVDRHGHIEDFNRRFAELWSIPAELLESRDDARVLSCALEQLVEPEQFLARVRELYGQPEAESLDTLLFLDGRQIERYSRPQVRGTEVVGRVWSFRDVTRRREAEAARERALKEAREAVQARDEFMSIASHELRTPLTSMMLALGAIPLLTQGPATDEVTSRLKLVVDIALRQGRLLSRLIEDLLSVARIQAGRMLLHSEAVDLGALVHEALQIVGGELERARCEVTVQAPSAVVGHWDRARLLQVATNLLVNAARHAGGAPVRISVDQEGDDARLQVADGGAGISPELQARIFERYERALPVTDQGGLGLGLYISDQLVRAHGGTIRVTSEAGAGATFTVLLPRGATEEGDLVRGSQ